jgi:hypothetical protein
MAVTASEVYRLTADELREKCAERRLDGWRPVRTLRRRLADRITSDQTEGADGQPPAQASVPTDLIRDKSMTLMAAVETTRPRSCGVVVSSPPFLFGRGEDILPLLAG